MCIIGYPSFYCLWFLSLKFYSLVVNVTVSKGFMEERRLDATNMKWK